MRNEMKWKKRIGLSLFSLYNFILNVINTNIFLIFVLIFVLIYFIDFINLSTIFKN